MFMWCEILTSSMLSVENVSEENLLRVCVFNIFFCVNAFSVLEIKDSFKMGENKDSWKDSHRFGGHHWDLKKRQKMNNNIPPSFFPSVIALEPLLDNVRKIHIL
ncbi:UNVERIFIED_CONTAM: hypothetical protein NCL1_48051 [Trichonephila clavipes]